jgi:hypothetical protein
MAVHAAHYATHQGTLIPRSQSHNPMNPMGRARTRGLRRRAVPLSRCHKAMNSMERWWARQDSNLGPRDYESHEQNPHGISNLKNPEGFSDRAIDRDSEAEPRYRARSLQVEETERADRPKPIPDRTDRTELRAGGPVCLTF